MAIDNATVAGPVPENLADTRTLPPLGEFQPTEMVFRRKGDTVHQHYHDFGHVTVITEGQFALTVADKAGLERKVFVTGPDLVYVSAQRLHTFECLSESGHAYCIWINQWIQEKGGLNG